MIIALSRRASRSRARHYARPGVRHPRRSQAGGWRCGSTRRARTGRLRRLVVDPAGDAELIPDRLAPARLRRDETPGARPAGGLRRAQRRRPIRARRQRPAAHGRSRQAVRARARRPPSSSGSRSPAAGEWTTRTTVRLIDHKGHWLVAWTPATINPALHAGDQIALDPRLADASADPGCRWSAADDRSSRSSRSASSAAGSRTRTRSAPICWRPARPARRSARRSPRPRRTRLLRARVPGLQGPLRAAQEPARARQRVRGAGDAVRADEQPRRADPAARRARGRVSRAGQRRGAPTPRAAVRRLERRRSDGDRAGLRARSSPARPRAESWSTTRPARRSRHWQPSRATPAGR